MNRNSDYAKWVACWGNATSIKDCLEAQYAKNVTLRYPIKMCFSGSMLRLHFSNRTGIEDVTLSEVYVSKTKLTSTIEEESSVGVTFSGRTAVVIPSGEEIVSDEIAFDVVATESLSVSIYLGEYTSLRAGTLVTGPLSLGYYSYGNHAKAGSIPIDLMRRTNWFYFLNTIDVLTSEDKHALICYGDSITAQAWPDNLSILLEKNKIYDVSVIRRAICGTRILREYNCITYASYGPKGERRFDNETDVAGADAVIIQHGINDIIHPVGTQVNVFRPWEDLPTVDELKQAINSLYVEVARAKGLSIISGTLLPIYGWRTYEPMREQMRTEFNTWLRSSNIFDKCIDFDRALARKSDVRQFVEEYDSGDHLHPSSDGYKRMAKEALNVLKEGINGKPYFKQD